MKDVLLNARFSPIMMIIKVEKSEMIGVQYRKKFKSIAWL